MRTLICLGLILLCTVSIYGEPLPAKKPEERTPMSFRRFFSLLGMGQSAEHSNTQAQRLQQEQSQQLPIPQSPQLPQLQQLNQPQYETSQSQQQDARELPPYGSGPCRFPSTTTTTPLPFIPLCPMFTQAQHILPQANVQLPPIMGQMRPVSYIPRPFPPPGLQPQPIPEETVEDQQKKKPQPGVTPEEQEIEENSVNGVGPAVGALAPRPVPVGPAVGGLPPRPIPVGPAVGRPMALASNIVPVIGPAIGLASQRPPPRPVERPELPEQVPQLVVPPPQVPEQQGLPLVGPCVGPSNFPCEGPLAGPLIRPPMGSPPAPCMGPTVGPQNGPPPCPQIQQTPVQFPPPALIGPMLPPQCPAECAAMAKAASSASAHAEASAHAAAEATAAAQAIAEATAQAHAEAIARAIAEATARAEARAEAVAANAVAQALAQANAQATATRTPPPPCLQLPQPMGPPPCLQGPVAQSVPCPHATVPQPMGPAPCAQLPHGCANSNAGCSGQVPYSPPGFNFVNPYNVQKIYPCSLGPQDSGTPRCSTLDMMERLQLRIMITLIRQAGLEPLFLQTNNYTIFAPVDQAFLRLPEWFMASLNTDIKLLRAFILQHFVKIDVPLETVGNEFLILNARPGGNRLRFNVYFQENSYRAYTVDGSRIILGNLETSSGRLNVMNRVLVPNPPRNAAQYFEEVPEFEAFISAVRDSDCLSILQGPDPITVFVPVNTAFEKFDLASLRANASALSNFIRYHVVPGVWYSEGLVDDQYLTTLYDKELKVSITSDGLTKTMTYINGMNRVIKPNIPVLNGVVHVIDSVLSIKEFYFYPHLSEFSIIGFGAMRRSGTEDDSPRMNEDDQFLQRLYNNSAH